MRAFAICAVIVAIAYVNSINNDFLQDDLLIVASNPEIRTISPSRFFSMPFWGDQSKAGIYRPLVLLVFSIEYRIWGRWAPGFRSVNLLLHALNGFFVLLLARSLLHSPAAAWAASAVYLLHPAHTEAVAGIAGRSELMAGAFLFAGWLFYRRGKTALCAVMFFFSLVCKENAIAFPGVLLLDTWIREGSIRRVAFQWKRFVPIVLCAFAYLTLRAVVLGTILIPKSEQYLGGTLTLLQRELTSGRAFLKYFQLLLAPVDVTGHYYFNSIPVANAGDWDAWLALLLVAAVIVFSIWRAKAEPMIALGLLFFFVTMFPVSNWIFAGGEVLAERYLYVPLFGIALAAAYIWSKIPNVLSRNLVAAGVMAASLLLVISHNYAWKNSFTFYQNAVRVLPNNVGARASYGMALIDANRLDEAAQQFEAGLRIVPDIRLFIGLVNVKIKAERNCADTLPVLERAIDASKTTDHLAYWTLGYCRELEGDWSKAEENYRRAVSYSRFPDSHVLFRWGQSLEKTGRAGEAIEVYRRVALIDPNHQGAKERVKP